MPQCPGIKRELKCNRQFFTVPVFLSQELFHLLGRSFCPAQNGESRIRLLRLTPTNGPVVFQAQEEVVLGRTANFDEEQSRQKGGTVNLFESVLHYRAERVISEPPQRNVRRRTGKSFSTRELDRGHAQALDIARVPDCAQRYPIVNLEQFLPCRSMPPVAVSASEAVSSARKATTTASSVSSFCSGFLPQVFS